MDLNPRIENIPFLSVSNLLVDSLRLDLIHPIISGNKWFKLDYYIQAAKSLNAKTIGSFGGPFSNHLVALSYAAKMNGIRSIGYLRYNENEQVTHSMQLAMQYGMNFIYLGRNLFNQRKLDILKEFNHQNASDTYLVDEGGYGILGARGAENIITKWGNYSNKLDNPLYHYDYIVCAVGTGTMMAGIINACFSHQQIVGIPVLKNEGTIKNEILNLLKNKNRAFELLHEFHQGGYAKTTPDQLIFMNQFWEQTKIPTDIVYTGKVFFAVEKLLQQSYFKPNSKILIIHSGGLQGNKSLAPGILKY